MSAQAYNLRQAREFFLMGYDRVECIDREDDQEPFWAKTPAEAVRYYRTTVRVQQMPRKDLGAVLDYLENEPNALDAPEQRESRDVFRRRVNSIREQIDDEFDKLHKHYQQWLPDFDAREQAWNWVKWLHPLDDDDEATFNPFFGEGSSIEEINWVYQNMHTSATKIDAPTPGAWGLLQWAKSGDQAMKAFYSQMYMQVAKKQIEPSSAIGGYSAEDDNVKSELEDLMGKLDKDICPWCNRKVEPEDLPYGD